MAKMRGVKLGNPNGAASLRRAGKGGVALRAAVSANAAACARDLERVIDDIQASGHISLRAIAAELTTRGIRTRRGGMWGVGNVRGVLARLPAQTAFHSSDRGPFGATARADTDKQPSEPPAQNDPFRWDQRTTHFASGLHQGALHGFDPAGEKGGARRSAWTSDPSHEGRDEYQAARGDGCQGSLSAVLHDRGPSH